VHPRTRQRLQDFGLASALSDMSAIHITEPLSYIEFMSLIVDSRFALTDSGGVQEETTYLGIPCLTLRDNTERPVTITLGTNRLVKPAGVDEAVAQVLSGPARRDCTVPLWDGRAAGRVVASLRKAGGNPSARKGQ
jgi:UDP-N-acetylglucosamine 2-epimerase (non-hydrolysing)